MGRRTHCCVAAPGRSVGERESLVAARGRCDPPAVPVQTRLGTHQERTLSRRCRETGPTPGAKMPPPLVRQPTHAGSWYTDDGAYGPPAHPYAQAQAAVAAAQRDRTRAAASKLSSQLDGFLAAAEVDTSRARALIVPHAGYSYSGPTAAYGYKAFDPRTLCVLAQRPAGARRPACVHKGTTTRARETDAPAPAARACSCLARRTTGSRASVRFRRRRRTARHWATSK